MIFITLGSQKFQFNRLLKKVDDLIEMEIIKEDVFAQIGSSDYEPKNYKYEYFLDRDTFASKIDACDTVITHGGTGVIISSVKKGKKVIAVPRLAKYGEHVDDHQIQLITQFKELNIIEPCFDVDELKEKYIKVKNNSYQKYISNTERIISSIERFIGE